MGGSKRIFKNHEATARAGRRAVKRARCARLCRECVLATALLRDFLPTIPGAARLTWICAFSRRSSLEQLDAITIRRLDAGSSFSCQSRSGFEQLAVVKQQIELAVPKKHPLADWKKLRPAHLMDSPFFFLFSRAAAAFLLSVDA